MYLILNLNYFIYLKYDHLLINPIPPPPELWALLDFNAVTRVLHCKMDRGAQDASGEGAIKGTLDTQKDCGQYKLIAKDSKWLMFPKVKTVLEISFKHTRHMYLAWVSTIYCLT